MNRYSSSLQTSHLEALALASAENDKIDENINKTMMKLITIFGLLDLCFLFFVGLINKVASFE
tara:strand:+ start:250 stop:438 length:189 start_codon:yes stop_codon:yes gene_type:complete